MIYFLVCLGVWLVIAIIVAVIARYKRRNVWFWTIAGIIGDLIALVILLQLPDIESDEPQDDPQSKQNPFNGELKK